MGTSLKISDASRRTNLEIGALGLFEQIFSHNPSGMVVFDHNAAFVKVNAAFLASLGAPEGKLIGFSLRDVLPALAAEGKAALRRVFEKGEPEILENFEGYLPQGSARAFGIWRVSFQPLFDEEGSVSFVSACFSDITSAREASPELPYLFGRLVEQSEDAIFVKDSESRYRYINPAGARILGRTPAEVIGRSDADLFSAEDAVKMRERDLHIMQQAQGGFVYEDFDQLGGTTIYFQTHKAPLRSISGEVLGLAGISRDITEQKKRAEEALALVGELREARADLEAERELRNRLVVDIGHDLRSPLSVAKMATELLECSASPEGDRAFLYRIRPALTRMEHMIRDLLDTSRIQAGRPLLTKRSPQDLKPAFEQCLRDMELLYPCRILTPNFPDMLPLHGNWDANAAVRVLENLLYNAIRGTVPILVEIAA